MRAERRASDGERGATGLFDLTITDATGLPVGYRGKNPLGHSGTSELYFTVLEGFAYDHKRHVAYNPLTYLAVEAGVRSLTQPEGRFSDGELLDVWVYAKREGHLSDSDMIPRRSLVHVAVSRGLCTEDEIEGGWKLPTNAFNRTLEVVRERYGVEPGRRPLNETPGAGGGYGAEGALDEEVPVSAIPLAKLDALTPDEARAQAETEGVEWPTSEDAHGRLVDEVTKHMHRADIKVVRAPTSVGKSWFVSTTPWKRMVDVTGDRAVIHAHAKKDSRDEYIGFSEETGVQWAALYAADESCPVCHGDHDSDGSVETPNGMKPSAWLKHQRDYKGVHVSWAHGYLSAYNDGLPCEEHEAPNGETETAECPYVRQWADVPMKEYERGGETYTEPAVDVLHVTHGFTRVPGLRMGHNIIFDEEPNFVDYEIAADPTCNPRLSEDDAEQVLTQQRIRDMVRAYLEHIKAPIRTFESLVSTARRAGDRTTDETLIAEMRRMDTLLEKNHTVNDDSWYFETEGAHTLAPAVTRAIWRGLRYGYDVNGRAAYKVVHEPPRLDAEANSDDGWNREFVTVVMDDENNVRKIRCAPDFSQARSVVGMDGHPTINLWYQNIHPTIEETRVLDPSEQRLWRRFERKLRVLQLGEKTRPAGKDGTYLRSSAAQTAAIVEHLREHAGDGFRTAITASGFEDDLRQIMEDAGIENPRTMHYGEEKSRNDFKNEPYGLVVGCIDSGDNFVYDLLAELDADATAERVDCRKCDGEGVHRKGETSETVACDKCDDDNTVREFGRKFVGPDADVAANLLASVRENHVAQAVGRYARGQDSDGGVVFVRTDAVPGELVDAVVERPVK